jgi:N-acetylglucosaminyldiphosphoundecaprenol N-acetyl-beta-D-mannosaminyltransferase
MSPPSPPFGAISSDAAADPLIYPIANLVSLGETTIEVPEISAVPDDLSRNVYGLLGVPIDAVDMETALTRISAAAANTTPFLLSTPNLDFLTTSRFDGEFRESLLFSDLCPPDGMPIVWLSRLLGVPVRERTAGSDIFATFKSTRPSPHKLSVFLFGGADGVVAKASQRINNAAGWATCVGWLNPGFGSVEDLSGPDVIDAINGSKADFLAVGLNAQKGQAWLLRNHHRLTVPVRMQLGAALNFEAGTIERAPAFLRARGLEWLWRIKEEPRLWSRYWRNLCVLLYLLPACVLPQAILLLWNRWCRRDQGLLIRRHQEGKSIVLILSGAAISAHVGRITAWFSSALAAKQPITIDLAGVHTIDARFLGLLLMLRKLLTRKGLRLTLVRPTLGVRWLLRLNGFDFLLASQHQGGR